MPELDILSRIAAHTARRVERWKSERPVEKLRAEPLYARAPRDFVRAFEGPGPRVIAEVKFASPSEGFLRPGDPSASDAVRVASSYLANGASALSILTERHFFAGAPEFLIAARRALPDAPILMKDFFIDPYQFELARACGADCILLIAALVGDRLPELRRQAEALGLSALVEVHNAEELAAAMPSRLIGVNSRDLRTLKTDLQVARDLARLAPGALRVAESGLKTRREIDELAALGYRGFLVGTSLMKAEDPGAALKALLA